MRLLDRTLAAIAALAITGFAQAQDAIAPDLPSLLGTEMPGIFSISGASTPRSSIDILDLTAAVEHRTSIAGAIEPLATTTPKRAGILNPSLDSRPHDVRRSGSATAKAMAPEPTDWMTLVCGLLVAAFIARRKASWISD